MFAGIDWAADEHAVCVMALGQIDGILAEVRVA
jgi:hypothetical protein